MARIRTIKPEFFRHAGLFDLEQETGLPIRVAFAGLWTVADRDGKFNWRPRELKLDALPHDAVDFGAVLDALARSGHIVRYEVDGHLFGCIPSWNDHQVINTREAKSTIPDRPAGCIETHVHAHAQSVHTEHEPRGINIPAPLRETVIARDGRKCVRCGSSEDLTVDHIFPRSIGGTHAISNLRCLCRSCNSRRPVQGDGLIADLKSDGLSLDDMQRTCMHVHAQVEGKGKEGKGKEGESSDDPPGRPAPKPDRAPGRTAVAWQAYAEAYKRRYGAEPLRNRTVNGQMANFVERIPGDEAAGVAGFYVEHNNALYCNAQHPVNLLLRDAESLRTQWVTGKRVNGSAPARRSDALMAGNIAAAQRFLEDVNEA